MQKKLLTGLLVLGTTILFSQTAQLVPYFKDGKYGYMNSATKQLVTPVQYTELVQADKDGIVRYNDQIWIDKDGKEIPAYGGAQKPDGLENVHPIPAEIGGGFTGGTVVCNRYKGEKCYHIYDSNWKPKPGCDFFDLAEFSEGLAAAIKDKDDGWGYVNAEGKFVIKPAFNIADPFKNGVAHVATVKKTGYIDTRGKTVDGPVIQQNPQGHDNGFTYVQQGDKYKFVNKEGKDITGYQYIGISPFKDGLCIVKGTNGSYGVINEKGTEVIPCTYKDINPYRKGYVQAKDYNDGWSIVSANNTVLARFDKKFSGFISQGNGLAMAGVALGPNVYRKVFVDETGFEYFSVGETKKDGCVSGDCINGEGVYVFPITLERYEGKFVDGVMEDKNAKVYDNTGTRIYEGAYANSRKNGYGELYNRNVLVYKGGWLDDQRHGTGTEYDGNQTFSRREVTYDHGKYIGQVKTVLLNRAGDYTIEDYNSGSKVLLGYYSYSGQLYTTQAEPAAASQRTAAPQPVEYTYTCGFCDGKGYYVQTSSRTIQQDHVVDNSSIGGNRYSYVTPTTVYDRTKVTCPYCNGKGSFVKTVKW